MNLCFWFKMYALSDFQDIHVNPLRAGLVKNPAALNKYSWAGHSAVLGLVNRDCCRIVKAFLLILAPT